MVHLRMFLSVGNNSLLTTAVICVNIGRAVHGTSDSGMCSSLTLKNLLLYYAPFLDTKGHRDISLYDVGGG
jgi:hypothetical protein